MLIWHDLLHDTAPLTHWIGQTQTDARILNDLDAVQTALEQDPQVHVLALVAPPRNTMAQALSEGLTPPEARQAWRSQTQGLLSLKRRNRRRVWLVDSEMALAYPGGLAQVLDCDPDELGTAPPSPDTAAVDPVLLLLAEHCLSSDPQTRAIAEELLASSADISDGALAAEVDTSAVYAAYHLHREQTDEERAISAQETENLYATLEQNLDAFATARANLEQAQADLTEKGAQAATLAAERQEARDKAAALEDETGRLRLSLDMQSQQNLVMAEELETLQQTHQQLTQRFKQVSAGFDSFHAQNADLADQLQQRDSRLLCKDTEIETMNRQLQDLMSQIAMEQNIRTGMQAELERVMHSYSIRFTKPLRGMARVLRRLGGRRT